MNTKAEQYKYAHTMHRRWISGAFLFGFLALCSFLLYLDGDGLKLGASWLMFPVVFFFVAVGCKCVADVHDSVMRGINKR